MDKKEAYEIVLKDLEEVSLFCGKYDAKNGNRRYMNGIWTVMEYIAYKISEERGEEFTEKFITNKIDSELRGEK